MLVRIYVYICVSYDNNILVHEKHMSFIPTVMNKNKIFHVTQQVCFEILVFHLILLIIVVIFSEIKISVIIINCKCTHLYF